MQSQVGSLLLASHASQTSRAFTIALKSDMANDIQKATLENIGCFGWKMLYAIIKKNKIYHNSGTRQLQPGLPVEKIKQIAFVKAWYNCVIVVKSLFIDF